MAHKKTGISNFARYIRVLKEIRAERGEFCECCGVPARHGHHIIPVGETSIHGELVYEKANIMILCDDDHALMHPLMRIYAWNKATIDRAQMLKRPT